MHVVVTAPTKIPKQEKTMAKTLKVKFKTKVGDLMWVNIQEGGVDQSLAKDGSKMQKVASVQFADDSQELKDMQAQLNTIWEQFRADKGIKQEKPKSNGIRPNKDKETKEPNGTSSVIFKTSATFDGKDIVVPIYNAKGEKVTLLDRIGNGSRGVIHGEAALYEFAGIYGITLYLKGIQLVELKPYEDGIDADDLSALYPDSFGETFEPQQVEAAPNL